MSAFEESCLYFNEADRQVVCLALAKLLVERPGFDFAIRTIAKRLPNGEQLLDAFKEIHAMRGATSCPGCGHVVDVSEFVEAREAHAADADSLRALLVHEQARHARELEEVRSEVAALREVALEDTKRHAKDLAEKDAEIERLEEKLREIKSTAEEIEGKAEEIRRLCK